MYSHFLHSVGFLLLPGPGITAPKGPHTPVQLHPLATRRLSPSSSSSSLWSEAPPLTRLRGGAWLCGAGRQAERLSPQLCSALCRSQLRGAALSGRRIQREGRTTWDRGRAWERRGQRRDTRNLTGLRRSPDTDTIIPGLDTELRRCTHWILPTKECRDWGERGGLYRAGRVLLSRCQRNADRVSVFSLKSAPGKLR